MKPRLIAFNGPPGCGKDTAEAAALPVLFRTAPIDADAYKFSHPLKRTTEALCGLLPHVLDKMPNAEKDAPRDFLGGRSYRQMQIMISEEWMKKVFGDQVFGDLLLNRMKQDIGFPFPPATFIVISDSGFASELIPLQPFFDIHIIQITRPGCTFEGDSRSYIELPNTKMAIIDNTGTKDAFEQKVVALVEKIIASDNND